MLDHIAPAVDSARPRISGDEAERAARVKQEALLDGLVIPACPLALNRSRGFDERRQRGLIRYYAAAGMGGLAVGVHTTQFRIRDPQVGLLQPVLQLASEELGRAERVLGKPLYRIAGICGTTRQATGCIEPIRT